jgi:hypothetical protein
MCATTLSLIKVLKSYPCVGAMGSERENGHIFKVIIKISAFSKASEVDYNNDFKFLKKRILGPVKLWV